jgi:hypothetical protein
VHVPEEQTLSGPQEVPLVTFVPVSIQAMAGAHTVVPLWHGLAGTHDNPCTHARQMPPLHTIPAPHDAPLVRLSVSMHNGVPVLQAVVPVRHGLPATSHMPPPTHAAHAPLASHTLSFPHDEPGGRFVILSMQVGCPCEQSRPPT